MLMMGKFANLRQALKMAGWLAGLPAGSKSASEYKKTVTESQTEMKLVGAQYSKKVNWKRDAWVGWRWSGEAPMRRLINSQ